MNMNTVPTYARFSRTSLVLLVSVISLSLIACQAVSTVINEIEVAQTVVSIGAPVVAAFAGPGAAIAQTVMGAVATGLGCVLTAAQAPGATTSTIGIAFDTCFGPEIVQNLPAGTPAYITAIVAASVSAVKFLIGKYGAKSGAEFANFNKAAGGHPVPVKLSSADHRRIAHIQAELAKSIATLKAAHR